jgi:hypothetical protein
MAAAGRAIRPYAAHDSAISSAAGGGTVVIRVRELVPATVALLAALLVAQLPAAVPVRAAAVETPIRAHVPVADPPGMVAPSTTTSDTAVAVAPAQASDTPAPTPTATPTPAPTASPKPSATPKPTATPKSTPTPTPSATMPPATIPPTPSPPPPTMPSPISATQFARVINRRTNPLRSYPSKAASVLVKVPHGQIAGLFSITSDGTWYRATYQGKTGYLLVNRMQWAGLVGRSLASQVPRVIVVGRIQQQLEVWDHGRLMLVSAVTTGRPELPTLLGTTRVMAKVSPYLFISPWKWPSIYWYPPGWADFAVLFRSGGYYFHDTRARPEYGYGIGTNVPHTDLDGAERTGSRGCVNTPYWAVRELYGWAQLGDPVVVIDA